MTGPVLAHGPGLGTGLGAAAGGSGAGGGQPLDWNWRLEVALPLLVLAVAWVLGQWRLARPGRRSAGGWRLAAGTGGLASLVIALLSPLDDLADMLFAAHMVQHLLLMMVAAPALLLAHPLPALLWGLPKPLRIAGGRLLRRDSPVRRAWRALTAVPVAWFLHTSAVWLWHLPVAYDAAVGDRLLHDLEHLAFFGSAVVFWWPLINPPPRVRPPAPYGLRIAYLLLAAFQSSLLGLLLAMSPGPLYASYTETSAGWGLTPEDDQRLGGLVMWGLGGAIDMLAVLVLVQRLLAAQDPGLAPVPGRRERRPVGLDPTAGTD